MIDRGREISRCYIDNLHQDAMTVKLSEQLRATVQAIKASDARTQELIERHVQDTAQALSTLQPALDDSDLSVIGVALMQYRDTMQNAGHEVSARRAASTLEKVRDLILG